MSSLYDGCFLSSYCDFNLCVSDSNGKIYLIKNNKSNNGRQYVIELTSSHYSIIECVGFKSIHYTINLDVISFPRVFNEFDYVFISNVLLV